MSFSELLVPAVYKAGNIIYERFTEAKREEEKPDGTVVTEADKASEAVIIEAIRKQFPDHAILAEEHGEITGDDKRYCWVVDGIDGTRNYVWGIPVFSVTTALLENGRPVCGIVYSPMMDAMFIAERGNGAWLRGPEGPADKKLAVSKQADIKKVHCSFGYGKSSSSREKSARILAGLSGLIGGYRVYVSMALELAYLAAGKLGGVIAVENAPWDCAAGVLLVQEAGGIVTDFEGRPYAGGFRDILAGTPQLHPQLLDRIQKGQFHIL